MTNVELRKLLSDVFAGHMFMKDRNYHTINELMHVLRYDEKLSHLTGVNISVLTLNDECICITCLEAFVDLKTLGIWFDDDKVESEVDEFEYEGEMLRYQNITVYEREVA